MLTKHKGAAAVASQIDLIKLLLQAPIAFHRVFAEIAQGSTAGLFLSQAWYWSGKTQDAEGWFYKTQSEWHKETGLVRSEQEIARKHLRRIGILEEKLSGQPAKLWYRLNLEILQTSMLDSANKNAENGKLECRIQQPAYKDARVPEITAETTSEENSLQKTSESYNGDGSSNDPTPWLHSNHPDRGMPIEHKRQRLRKPLADDDWLKTLLLEFSEAFPFEAFNDDAWWIAVSQPLEGVFDREWLNREFGKIQAYLIEKPRKQPRSSQGWKTFVRGWLQRAYEYQRKYTRG